MNFPSDKGILPSLMGGLGNQLWIVAAAYAASKTHECPLYIPRNPVQNNKHNKLQNDYSESIFKYFGHHLIETSDQANQLARYHGYNFSAPANGFVPWHVRSHRPGTVMYSYFQYYPPLAPFEHDLRSVILQGLEQGPKNYIEHCKTNYTCSNAAFLHIRRGDYVGLSTIHYNQPIEYYMLAVKRLLESTDPPSILYILSDDPSWVLEQPYFKSNPIFQPVNIQDELESLALMSLCTKGAICANSTFSWWGAFLGAYGNRSPVYVPEQWISEPPIVSLFPPEWIVLKESEIFPPPPPISIPDTVVVTLCDKTYYHKAKKTIEEVRTKGCWDGCIVLITVDFPADAEFLQKWNITEYHVSHISTDNLVQQLKDHPIRPMPDNRHFGKLYQWDKFYAFDTFFTAWNRVVFLDAGMRVLNTIQPLLDLPWKGRFLAPDDSGPYDNGNRFQCQLDLTANPVITDLLFSVFPKSILTEKYFLNCIFVYDTELLDNVSVQELTSAMNAYPICLCNEMVILNLFFTFKLSAWEPFPITVKDKYLFSWFEGNYKDNPHWSRFHFMKYPRTI